MVRIIATGVAGIIALAALSACSNSNNNTAPLAGDLRVVNGVPDSNGLNSSINDASVASGTPFGQSSGLNAIPEGGYTVQLQTGNGNGGTLTGNANSVSIDHNNITTVYAYGSVANANLAGFAAEESVAPPSSSTNFVLQFADAAYAATGSGSGSLNVIMVAPGSGIGGVTPTAVPFGHATTAGNVAAGTYEIIVTDGGGATVYDSGPAGIALPPTNTNVVQIGIVDTSAAQLQQYGSGVALILLDNNGGQQLLFAGQH
ncbi:MAG: DUF4397 domain-containing protein [Nevskia sp.]|nr:DUF4397 domain-containing protein [Nevskia sp.]